jgi:hypothetical protein
VQELPAALQLAGENLLTFEQSLNDTYIWGVTDLILTEPAITPGNTLIRDVVNTGSFGNRFDGQTDEDGLIDFVFDSAGDDIAFSFKAFDIDLDTEVELFLNGGSLGFLDAGISDALSDYAYTIGASSQIAGENTITFEQAINDTFIWGVTDLLITG